MKFHIRASAYAALLSIAMLSTICAAQPSPRAKPLQVALSNKSIENYKELFAAKTGISADEVGPAPLRGFVEVIVGTTVYYMDTTGKWLFDGHLINLATRTSVTAVRKASLEQGNQPKMDWKMLNLADAIKIVRGSPKPGRVLVIFEDPNCGFCKKLNPELKKLNDITIFIFPISILGPDSKSKNEALWCEPDRFAVWDAVMNGVETKPGAACDMSGLERNTDLAQKLHVTGTPTLFFADGSRSAGYLEAGAIENRIAAIKK